MKYLKLALIPIYFISWFSYSNADVVEEYTIGVGDQIRILVYDEPDLTIQTTIGDDGKISYPFLGELLIVGKTTQELQRLIYSGLKGDYLISPSIQVSILSYRPFFILGEVKKPGAYPFQPGLTIDRAIALAGGMTERASEDKIFVKKDNMDNRSATRASLQKTILPGDTITVKQGFF